MKLLNPREVSEETGIAIRTVRSMFKSKSFPTIQIGKRKYVMEDDLHTFLKDHRYSTIVC